MMTLSLGELSALIGTIYDAGLDASGARWPAVLERLSRLLGGGAPASLTLERGSFAYARVHSSSLDPAAVDLYTSYYARRDPVVVPRLACTVPGTLCVASELASAAELTATEFYTDFARSRDMLDCAATVLLRDGSASASLFVTRAHGAGTFGQDTLELLDLLLPHVARSAKTSLMLAGLASEQSATHQAIDSLAAGVILADAAGRVRYANRAAEALLGANDGLGVEACRATPGGGRLRADTLGATVALRQRIAEAAGSRCGTNTIGSGSRIILARRSGQRPLSLLVVPLTPESAAHGSWHAIAERASVVVIVTDRQARYEAGRQPPVQGDGVVAPQRKGGQRTRSARGLLTVREQEVEALLADRRTNAEIAAVLGMSPHTARHHTESVLRKLGVSSRRLVTGDH